MPTPVSSLALAVMFGALLLQFILVHSQAEGFLIHWLLMSVVVLASAFLGDRQGKFDIRQPWAVLMVFHLPFWVIGSFKTLVDPEQRIGWIPWSDEQMPLALLLISTGFVCIAVGYRIGIGLIEERLVNPPKAVEWDCSRLVPLAIITYIIVWPVRYYFYQNFLSVPYSQMMLQGAAPAFVRTFDGLIPRFLLLVVWAAFYSNPARRKLLWLGLSLTVGELVWAVIYGSSKTAFFMPVFIPIVPYIILKQKIPVLRTVLSAALLVLVAYPYATTLRDEYYILDGPGRAEARKIAFEQGWFWSAPSAQGLQLYANQALDRSGGLGALSQLLQMNQNGELDLKGLFYLRSVAGLVPRIFWPGKPILLEGVYFNAYLQGHRGIESIDPATISGSVSPTLFGSFFWNLGWPGLVLTSIFLGLFSGVVYGYLKRQRNFSDPASFLYYSVFLTVLETTEQEVVKLPSSLIWGLAVAWVAIWFLGWHKGGKSPAGGLPETQPESRRKRGRVLGRGGKRVSATARTASPASSGGTAALPS